MAGVSVMTSPKHPSIVCSTDEVVALRKRELWQLRRPVNIDPEGPRPTRPCPYGQAGDTLGIKESWSDQDLTVYPCPPCWYRADFAGTTDDPATLIGEDGRCTLHAGAPDPAQCIACAAVARRCVTFRWKSALTLPPWLVRCRHLIRSVRCERLWEATTADAIAEGVRVPVAPDGAPLLALTGRHAPASYHQKGEKVSVDNVLRWSFLARWDDRYAERWSSSTNPWTWVVSLELFPKE
jgi:hypothetical protein